MSEVMRNGLNDNVIMRSPPATPRPAGIEYRQFAEWATPVPTPRGGPLNE